MAPSSSSYRIGVYGTTTTTGCAATTTAAAASRSGSACPIPDQGRAKGYGGLGFRCTTTGSTTTYKSSPQARTSPHTAVASAGGDGAVSPNKIKSGGGGAGKAPHLTHLTDAELSRELERLGGGASRRSTLHSARRTPLHPTLLSATPSSTSTPQPRLVATSTATESTPTTPRPGTPSRRRHADSRRTAPSVSSSQPAAYYYYQGGGGYAVVPQRAGVPDAEHRYHSLGDRLQELKLKREQLKASGTSP